MKGKGICKPGGFNILCVHHHISARLPVERKFPVSILLKGHKSQGRIGFIRPLYIGTVNAALCKLLHDLIPEGIRSQLGDQSAFSP